MLKLTPLMAGYFLAAVSAASAASVATPAVAHETVYQTILSGAAEAPPNPTPGSGFATITFDFDLATMRVEATFSDLLGTVTAAHLHCCTAMPGSGTAGVASATPSFPGFPSGVTSGSYDTSFDMTLASSYNPAFITSQGGSVSGAMNALIAGLDAGQAYFNLHTSAYPGGEIRGFMTSAPAIPEPSTWALLFVGLGLTAVASRRGPGRLTAARRSGAEASASR